jgi:hypothetical protein
LASPSLRATSSRLPKTPREPQGANRPVGYGDVVTAKKSERLMNLTICLLVARNFISKDRIRQAVEAYHDLSDDAFDRMFDRDK